MSAKKKEVSKASAAPKAAKPAPKKAKANESLDLAAPVKAPVKKAAVPAKKPAPQVRVGAAVPKRAPASANSDTLVKDVLAQAQAASHVKPPVEESPYAAPVEQPRVVATQAINVPRVADSSVAKKGGRVSFGDILRRDSSRGRQAAGIEPERKPMFTKRK